jgi:hypothetical protein
MTARKYACWWAGALVLFACADGGTGEKSNPIAEGGTGGVAGQTPVAGTPAAGSSGGGGVTQPQGGGGAAGAPVGGAGAAGAASSGSGGAARSAAGRRAGV